jgi:DNA-3-methyladenine glycosylase
MKPLPLSFYHRDDVVNIARELLGKVIQTRIDGIRCSGIITETEAYAGTEDKASHAHGGRRTARNEAMYGQGGQAYVYLCYGIHRLFNVVTNTLNYPDAVLIRAMIPVYGMKHMEERRKLSHTHPRFSAGPGTLTQALGIDMTHNTISLHTETLSILDGGFDIEKNQIKCTPRIGVDYAGEDALLPYRCLLSGSTLDEVRLLVGLT